MITTHVLDTALGKPAQGVRIELFRSESHQSWQSLEQRVTNSDGRIDTPFLQNQLQAGTYRIDFHSGEYFTQQKRDSFYPSVSVTFTIVDSAQHFHIPLLISGFGYSTYRGS